MNENKHGSRELPPANLKSQNYGQTGNVKPLTTNRSLSFAVKWPNLDLKVSIDCRDLKTAQTAQDKGLFQFFSALKVNLYYLKGPLRK